MGQPRLRLCYSPGEVLSSPIQNPEHREQDERVTVPLSEIMPWLMDAASNRRAWLRDFEDEEITLSADLYEVILAYQHIRRCSA